MRAFRTIRAVLASALVLSLTLPAARAAPTDPYQVAANGITLPKNEARSLDRPGPDGSFSYAFPITVPPGHNGLVPALSLQYSSNAPLRGGIAAGWSLPLPSIEVDRSVPDRAVYVADLGSGRTQLVPVTDPSLPGFQFRARVDSDQARFEQFIEVSPALGSWTASLPDGRRFNFIETSSAPYPAHQWRIGSQLDRDGNRIDYKWTKETLGTYTEQVLSSIEYGANSAAGVVAHAKVEFQYAPMEACAGGLVPTGATIDQRGSNGEMHGSRRLQTIVTSVRDTPTGAWRVVRRVALRYDGYELSCSNSHAPLRYLTGITETAYSPTGVATAMPTKSFSYGPTAPSFAEVRDLGLANGAFDSGWRLGATQMVRDMDGDGLPDLVRVDTVYNRRGCIMHTRKGVYGGGFSTVDIETELPSLDWNTPGAPEGEETCTLGGQFARRPFVGSAYTCGSANLAQVSYNFVDWNGDGIVDLLTNVWMSSWTDDVPGGDFPPLLQYAGAAPQPPTEAQLQECADSGGSVEGNTCMCGADSVAAPTAPPGSRCQPACEIGCHPPGEPGPGPGDPSPPGPVGPVCSFSVPTPERGINGAPTTWRLFSGESAGQFVTDPQFIGAPLGLVTGRPETAIWDQLSAPNLPRLMDVDGDGRVDLVSSELLWNGAPALPLTQQAFGRFSKLMVWRNLGSDGLAPPATWTVPLYNQAAYQASYGPVTTGAFPYHFSNSQELLTADLNGDGRVDVVGNTNSSPTLVALWNHGGSFAAPQLVNAPGPLQAYAADLPTMLYDSPYLDGARIATRQLLDVDADGLPDLLDTTPATGDVTQRAAVSVRINYGGWFGPPIPANTALWFANQRLQANGGAWEHWHNALDVTGDGVLDLVERGADGHLRIHTDPVTQPLRLLRTIDNGQGAVTRVDYAPSSDPTVVDSSTRTLPSPHWVVRGITIDPGAGQPAATSTFTYANPLLFNTTGGAHDPASFVGFATMTSDAATTASTAERSRTVSTFTYLGGTLRPATEWVYGSAGLGFTVPLRHAQHVWNVSPLYSGLPVFAFESATIEHHCGAGATEATCLADAEGTQTRTRQYDAVLGADGRPRAYLLARESVGIDATHTRQESKQYRIDQSYAHYQFDLTRTQTEVADSSSGSMSLAPMARTRYALDAAGHPLTTWVSTADGVELATVRTFDLAGNVKTVRRPSQTALVSTTAYDAFLLTELSTTNERGQIVKSKYDLGTGQIVSREGPSSRTYAPCAGCANVTAYAPETWTIDGFGRVLAHAVAADAPTGGGYGTVIVDEHVYDDVTVPTKVTHRSKVDWAGTLIGTTEERKDGLGRLVSRTAPGTASVANVTTYRYDAAGNLAAVDQQDPRRDTAAYVTTSYLYDALGRTTRMTRPDGSSLGTTYDGDDTLVTELSPIDGTGARTQYRRDRLGRIASVDQYDIPTAGQHAVTQTTYDALDRPVRIVDADGTTTSMTHDWAGRRTSITRGPRTWKFGYDADGNLTSRQAPLPTPTTPPADYTSYWAYDVLGRVQSHTAASRGMTAARMSQLGIGTTIYLYDSAANGVGQVASVVLPSGRVDYAYDVHGQPLTEQRQLTVPTASGTVVAAQSVTRTYAVDGQLASEKWDDNSQWSVAFDSRALPYKVSWLDPTANRWMAVANTSRGILGQQRSRDGSTYDQRRAWGYDALGRVVSDRIWKVSTNATWGERTYGYDDFGELRAISGTVDGQRADATFNYDAGHRLLDAAGPMNYTARFTYTGGGNVTRATIVGGDTGTRDVRYQYGARDPQAVDALVDATTNVVRASVAYDASGNAAQRTTAGGTYAQTWDGDDALREVIGPAGTERYYYDHTGTRMGSVGPDGVKFWFGSNETRFTGTGVQTTRWMHLAYGDVVARVENKTALEMQYVDALQNLILTTSPTGTITGSFLYGAFGEVVASRGAANHRRQFNGKENDAASGLRYYGARYYDPLLLRWISSDPLYQAMPELAKTEPQRGNWYAFTVNNPIRYSDPDGRDVTLGDVWDEAKAKADAVAKDVKEYLRRQAEEKRKAEEEHPGITGDDVESAAWAVAGAAQDVGEFAWDHKWTIGMVAGGAWALRAGLAAVSARKAGQTALQAFFGSPGGVAIVGGAGNAAQELGMRNAAGTFDLEKVSRAAVIGGLPGGLATKITENPLLGLMASVAGSYTGGEFMGYLDRSSDMSLSDYQTMHARNTVFSIQMNTMMYMPR